ncbi:MAG: hypothetical protein ACOH2V_12245 [Candidatus Saccharimonadaceae bacterium]
MKIQENNYDRDADPGLLVTCKCFPLVDEIEKHVIVNKEPFLRLIRKDIECEQLEYFLTLDIQIPVYKKFDLYFHLGDAQKIDFKINRKQKFKKLTLDDKIYKDVILTLVVF